MDARRPRRLLRAGPLHAIRWGGGAIPDHHRAPPALLRPGRLVDPRHGGRADGLRRAGWIPPLLFRQRWGGHAADEAVVFPPQGMRGGADMIDTIICVILFAAWLAVLLVNDLT